MGHDNILGTEAYLHTTPALLAIAAKRFKRRVASARSRRAVVTPSLRWWNRTSRITSVAFATQAIIQSVRTGMR
jgi:hypothetical protein